MTQAQTSQPTRWVTAAALAALAARGLRQGGTFTADELATWTAGTLTPEQRVHASSRLCLLAFVQHEVRLVSGQRVDTYTVTAEGHAAIDAARLGHVRKSGPKGTRAPNPVREDDLATRLWALVRLRKLIDSDSAARTLCDAGDDAAFERTRATVRKTLRRWELAGALLASARLVKRRDDPVSSNGNKRYVLVEPSSPTPPRWRQVVKARAQAGGVPA